MPDQAVQQILEDLHRRDLYRSPLTVDSPAGPRIRIGGREFLCFCSNNYLGLANHPRIIQAVQEGAAQWGFGSGASRLVCGQQTPHEQLQQRLARWLGKDATLIFPTGYMTNLAILSSLPGKNDLVLLDKLVHASLLSGAQASGATVRVFPHRQTDKLKRLLDRGGYERTWIVADSVFSMDGDCARLAELAEIKSRYDAWLVVDEAHALGCLGPDGKGVAAEQGVLDQVDLFVGTFSKALGGAGGFVAGSHEVIELLINKARPFIYTTAIPAVNCLAAVAALDIIASEPDRRDRLNDNATLLRNRCREMGLDTGDSETYIIPMIIGDAAAAMQLSQTLWDKNIFVPPIRPPTVAPGAARLRLSLTSEHTRDDIEYLCQCLGR